MTLEDLHDEDENLLDGTNGSAGTTNTEPGGDDGSSDGNDNNGNDGNDGSAGAGTSDDPASGIEQFLAQYGISGAIITLEDEDGVAVNKHFNELTNEEQFNVLSDLAKSGAPSVESKYGLDPEEIGLLNFVRKSGKPVNEVIGELAEQRALEILSSQNSGVIDFQNMPDDTVTLRWLWETNPQATEEELQEELNRLKEGKFYTNNAEKLRQGYVQEAEANQARLESQEEEDRLQELENDRALIATAVSNINEVVGFSVNNDSKNEILEKLLEVNAHGDSLFMEEVFSDPEKLFKAAWLFYNSENYLDQLDQKHKRDLANEYKKGRNHAVNGLPSNPISGTGGFDDEPSGSSNTPVRQEKRMTLDDLHSED